MARHNMVLSEADPNHAGCSRRYYTMIDVSMTGQNWVWNQVDLSGNFIGTSSNPFPTEDAAKSDALGALNGDWWEK